MQVRMRHDGIAINSRVRMADPINRIDYRHLTPAECSIMAQDILDSLLADSVQPLITDEQAEVERRITDIDAGRTKCVPWQDVRQAFLAG